MNRKEFLAAEWATATAHMPELDAIAKEAKRLFDVEGVVMVFGKRKPEPEQPKYVEPFA